MNLDLATWLIVGLVACCSIAVGIYLLRARLERLRYQEQIAELEFQESLMAGLDTGRLGEDARFLQKPVADLADQVAPGELGSSPLPQSVTAESSGVMEIMPAAAAGHPGELLSADMAAAGIIRQLNATGLLASVDGYIPLHGNPKGVALLRFRNGKQALLVPHMESEVFVRHNGRRADFIIMTGADGRGFVVTQLEQFLADSVVR